MMRSLYSGVSGLRNHQTRMDVIGNNISNVNTTAYKASRAVFQDVYSQNVRQAGTGQPPITGGTNPSQIGLGVRLSAVDTIFNPAATARTDNPTDLAIEGDGFFIIHPPNQKPEAGERAGWFTNEDGQETVNAVFAKGYLFTRAGNFYVDAEGRLVTSDGYYVMGFVVEEESLMSDDALEIILNGEKDRTEGAILVGQATIDKEVAQAAVNAARIALNLAREIWVAAEKVKTAQDAVDRAETNLEEAEEALTDARSELALVSGGTDPAAIAAAEAKVRAAEAAVVAAEKAIEATEKALASAKSALIALTGSDALDPADAQASFDNATDVFETEQKKLNQANADLAVGQALIAQGNKMVEEGTQALTATTYVTKHENGLQLINLEGEVGISFDDTGTIWVMRGEQKVAVFQVALAMFTNNAGLEKKGNSLYSATGNTGIPIATTSQLYGAGKINPGGLEMSNVDLASEFTDMIVTQRGFQANSRVITTSDAMLEELVNLKR